MFIKVNSYPIRYFEGIRLRLDKDEVYECLVNVFQIASIRPMFDDVFLTTICCSDGKQIYVAESVDEVERLIRDRPRAKKPTPKPSRAKKPAPEPPPRKEYLSNYND